MVQNATSGLVPDWSAGPATNTSYGYDATRTPFRVALDVCWSGDTRGKTFSQKIGTFFAGIGATNIVDGYNVNGHRDRRQQELDLHRPGRGRRHGVGIRPRWSPDAYTRVAADAKASMHQLLRPILGAASPSC